MEVNIKEYLTDEEMSQIAIEEWRSMCREACNGSAERILANIGHEVAAKMVAEALGDSADEIIRDKAVEVIKGLTQYTVFKRPDVWDRSESPAYTVLSNAIRDNAHLVNEMVAKAIKQISKKEALEVLKSGVIQINPHPRTA